LALIMTTRVSLWLAGLLCLAAGSALAEAGRFQFVVGQVTVERSGAAARPAAKGDAVQEGDLITAAPGAAAQLRMADDGLIALRPDSVLRIETYRLAGAADGSEKGILGLIKGSFRTLTGLIGRGRKDAYLVRTPTATVGIRGTDHEPAYIPEGGWSGAPDGQPGTYDKVNAGETFIETQGGRIELSANEVGFAPPRVDAVPVRLEAVPAFMRATPAPQGRADMRALRAEAAPDRDRGDGPQRPGRDGPGQAGPRPQAQAGGTQVQALPNAVTGGGLVAAPLGLAVAGADQYSDGHVPGSGAGINQPGDLTVLRDKDGQVAAVGSAGGFRYLRGDARLVDAGGVKIADGGSEVPVLWGIYAGGRIVDGQGERAPRFMAIIGGLSATSDAQITGLHGLGRQTYTLVDGSKPANGAGKLGGEVQLANVTVDFATLSVSNARLAVKDASGIVFVGASTGAVPLKTFTSSGIPLAVTLTAPGSPVAPIKPDQGHFNGIPVGPTAKGLVGAYDMNYPLGSTLQSIAGVVVLKR
jgi:hypothetical protein